MLIIITQKLRNLRSQWVGEIKRFKKNDEMSRKNKVFKNSVSFDLEG